MSGKRYGTKSEKQKAYRERKKNLRGGGNATDVRAPSTVQSATPQGVCLSPAQNNLPVPGLAEPHTISPLDEVKAGRGEARESTNSRTVPVRTDNSSEFTTTPDSCGGQNYLPNPAYETASHEFQVYDARIVTYDKKKYPNRQAWQIAVQRVERAIRWAKKFPNHIYVGDLKFQTLDWQYHNEGVKVPTS